MTPGARVAAAAEVLDIWQTDVPAEKALTNWARSHRFAGSKDRAAIRDYVFDAMRQWRSCAALGGGSTGRALMIGLLRKSGIDPASLFTGQGYAPSELTEQEATATRPMTRFEELDCPDWLAPRLEQALGTDFEPVMQRQQARALLFLRVNLRKTSVADAISALAKEGVAATPHPLSPTALVVTDGNRKLQHSAAYLEGLVEIQDAASQAVCDAIGVPDGGRVLDYCAGGGGKSLALAARSNAVFFAYDSAAARMSDLPARAERAGVDIQVLNRNGLGRDGLYDLVVTDVPCSGSGTWARQPDAKWTFCDERLQQLCAIQASILDEAQKLCAPQGRLAYVTCSLLADENEQQVTAFLARHEGWSVEMQQGLSPISGADGLFVAVFSRYGCMTVK